VVATPPAPLDTSAENLDRNIRITHPETLNRKQHDKLLATMTAVMEKVGKAQANGAVQEDDSESSSDNEERSLSLGILQQV